MNKIDISLWEQSKIEQEQERERFRFDMLQRIDNALFSLMHSYHWDKVYVYGSVLQKGRFYHQSDVDIAFLGLNKKDLFLHNPANHLMQKIKFDYRHE